MELIEIDQKIAELQQLRSEAELREREKLAAQALDEARTLIGELVTNVQRLHDLGHLPPRLVEALTDGTGKFNPGMYIKRPKTRPDTSAS